MASSSSEFLTFMRHITTRKALRPSITRTPVQSRLAVLPRYIHSTPQWQGSASKQDQHATEKPDQLDVQSEQAGKGQAAKASGSGGAATSQSDSQNSTAKAKKDHPEAPDTVIGMQDERGAKGS